jgi:methylase of polypeptide subunit release factors
MRFGPIDVAYDDQVLEPRPWTVEQSRWAIELLARLPPGPVLELGAGAGQIGLVVAVETGRLVVQVDADERACRAARRNAEAAGARTEVRCAGFDDALASGERFPLVLADPPYVPSDAVDEWPEDPDHAVDGGPDGLEPARACLRVGAGHLRPSGLLLLQLGGPDQAAALAGEAAGHGLEAVETRHHDPDGALLLLRRPEAPGGGPG